MRSLETVPAPGLDAALHSKVWTARYYELREDTILSEGM